MKKTSQPRAISSVLIPFGLKDFPCWWEIKTDISLPQNRFWVIGGSKLVAKLIHTCVLRRKLHRPTENQRLAELPKERLEASAPFTNSGMDCFGPFIVKKACKECPHMSVLKSCPYRDARRSCSFINALRCCISFRGAVRQRHCDQGSNFVGPRN